MTATLCTIEELAQTGSRGFRAGEGEWPLKGFLVLTDAGSVRAWLNVCPHAGHPLDLVPHRFLTSDRAYIQCSSHGALFERDSGRCIAGPCVGRNLRPLDIEVVAGEVRLASTVAEADNSRRNMSGLTK